MNLHVCTVYTSEHLHNYVLKVKQNHYKITYLNINLNMYAVTNHNTNMILLIILPQDHYYINDVSVNVSYIFISYTSNS